MNRQDIIGMCAVLQKVQVAAAMMLQGCKLLDEALATEEATGESMQIAREMIEGRLQKLLGDFVSLMGEGL